MLEPFRTSDWREVTEQSNPRQAYNVGTTNSRCSSQQQTWFWIILTERKEPASGWEIPDDGCMNTRLWKLGMNHFDAAVPRICSVKTTTPSSSDLGWAIQRGQQKLQLASDLNAVCSIYIHQIRKRQKLGSTATRHEKCVFLAFHFSYLWEWHLVHLGH